MEDYLIFGGRLRYSGLRNYVNPGIFSVAKIGSDGIGKAMHIGFGKIAPAWSSETFVMADGPRSLPVCVDSAALIDHLKKASPADLRRQVRHAGTLKRKWTAKDLQDSDAVTFVVAKNTIITVLEKQRHRSLSSSWTLAGLDPKTGKVVWTKTLPSAAFPGGILVDRLGRIIVVYEDGSVSCFG